MSTVLQYLGDILYSIQSSTVVDQEFLPHFQAPADSRVLILRSPLYYYTVHQFSEDKVFYRQGRGATLLK